MPNHAAIPNAPPGIWLSNRTLRRGDTYTVQVYTPRPTDNELAAAGADYDRDFSDYLTIDLTSRSVSPHAGAPPARSRSRRSSPPGRRAASRPTSSAAASTPAPRSSASTARRRSRAGAQAHVGALPAPTPHLRDSARLRRRGPGLPGRPGLHLHRDPAAEGAHARRLPVRRQDRLLPAVLRRDGAAAADGRHPRARRRPASPPARSTASAKEYVVRDLDAHSWVEVWFPGYGWVTFDPTPPTAPPRSQARDRAAGLAGDVPQLGGTGARDPRPAWRRPAARRGGSTIGGGVLAALLLAGGRLRRSCVRRRPGALLELERALRRTRRGPGPGTTLQALEPRFARSPAAAGYVRALRDQRYRGRGDPPTGAQRRGLRSELARGAGLRGRLRAWWALPPRRSGPGPTLGPDGRRLRPLPARDGAARGRGLHRRDGPAGQGARTSSRTRPRSARRSAARTSARASSRPRGRSSRRSSSARRRTTTRCSASAAR